MLKLNFKVDGVLIQNIARDLYSSVVQRDKDLRRKPRKEICIWTIIVIFELCGRRKCSYFRCEFLSAFQSSEQVELSANLFFLFYLFTFLFYFNIKTILTHWDCICLTKFS